MQIHWNEKMQSKLWKALAFGLILFGIVTRVLVYYENRNLFIDESNLARNVFEKDFISLAKPLSYEQYAPPIFMWMLKLSSFLFGIGEKSLRFYTLISSLLSLGLMYWILKKLTSFRSLWYPIGLMSLGYMMLRYSTELKQYMPDVMWVLLLIAMALWLDRNAISKWKFFLYWFLIGSLAIWASMPSAFLLAGIGAYYFFESWGKKAYAWMGVIVILSLAWLAQFGLYYFLVLKPQIDSNYLQNFHEDYFLILFPKTYEEWKFNLKLINGLFKEASGFQTFAHPFNIIMAGLGAFLLIKKWGWKSLLILMPIMLTIIAAALHQFSLIPRVALFMMPLFLILIGVGFQQLMALKIKFLPILGCLAGLSFIYFFSSVRYMLSDTFQVEPIEKAIDYVQNKKGFAASQVYVHYGARPAYIYYTQMHPDCSRWVKVKECHLLNWDVSLDSINRTSPDTMAMILTSVYPKDLAYTCEHLGQNKKPIDSLVSIGCKVFIYARNRN